MRWAAALQTSQSKGKGKSGRPSPSPSPSLLITPAAAISILDPHAWNLDRRITAEASTKLWKDSYQVLCIIHQSAVFGVELDEFQC